VGFLFSRVRRKLMAVTLSTVDTMIEAIQSSGQMFTVDGVTYSQANLDALIRLREALQRDTERGDGTRPTIRAVNFGSASY